MSTPRFAQHVFDGYAYGIGMRVTEVVFSGTALRHTLALINCQCYYLAGNKRRQGDRMLSAICEHCKSGCWRTLWRSRPFIDERTILILIVSLSTLDLPGKGRQIRPGPTAATLHPHGTSRGRGRQTSRLDTTPFTDWE